MLNSEERAVIDGLAGYHGAARCCLLRRCSARKSEVDAREGWSQHLCLHKGEHITEPPIPFLPSNLLSPNGVQPTTDHRICRFTSKAT